MAIGTVEFDLSMIDPNTGLYMTANMYTVEGITNPDGSLRLLSIGEVVMALCLKRASELEADIIQLMETLNDTTIELEDLTEIEDKIVEWADDNYLTEATFNLRNYTLENGIHAGATYYDYLTSDEYGVCLNLGDNVDTIRINSTEVYDGEISYDDFISLIESEMDANNSFSQQKMIELQSQTGKRDQCYDMISNVLKSINTTLTGNVNNL